MHAFSKESLLKPAFGIGPSNKQALVEESKEPQMKGSLYKTPQSQISQSTFSSDSREEAVKELAS